MRRAVLFDLDDTLTDRRTSIVRYARRFEGDFREDLAAGGAAGLEALLHEADGRGYAPPAQVFSALLRELPWRRAPAASRLADHWEASFPTDTAGREGLLSTLEALRARGFVLGVVTNGREKLQQPKIDALGIRPLLSALVVSEAAGFEKPDARIFERCLDELGPVSSAWFVGDHPRNDILGAEAAGLPAIWLRGVHPWPASVPPPRHAVDSLSDVIEIVGG
jgi:putative hydrolase of the HAD superfamily